MAKSKPPPESHDKAGDNGDAAPSMDRFKDLTRRVLGVSREELAAAERRHEDERAKKDH